MKLIFDKQKGQASRLLLVLAIVVLVAVIIVYLVIRTAEKPPAPAVKTTPTVPLPVYEQTLGTIRFVFESAIDWGNVLKASSVPNNNNLRDIGVDNTGAKFVQVTIAAQNVGKQDVQGWSLGNIIDSQGRIYESIGSSEINPWLPNPNPCGQLLHPAFDPTPCTKMYEISKESTGLKVVIQAGKANFLLDLIVK